MHLAQHTTLTFSTNQSNIDHQIVPSQNLQTDYPITYRNISNPSPTHLSPNLQLSNLNGHNPKPYVVVTPLGLEP